MTVAFVGVGVQPSRVTASKLADDGSYISSEESKKNPPSFTRIYLNYHVDDISDPWYVIRCGYLPVLPGLALVILLHRRLDSKLVCVKGVKTLLTQ